MKEKEEKTEESKLKSRKFSVWVVWLIITILVLIVLGISIIVTKDTNGRLVDLFSNTIQNFFYISAFYLGANVIQKGAFALADAWSSRHESEKEVEGE